MACRLTIIVANPGNVNRLVVQYSDTLDAISTLRYLYSLKCSSFRQDIIQWPQLVSFTESGSRQNKDDIHENKSCDNRCVQPISPRGLHNTWMAHSIQASITALLSACKCDNWELISASVRHNQDVKPQMWDKLHGIFPNYFANDTSIR